MDSTSKPKPPADARPADRWAFVKTEMPQVAALIQEKRREWGADHVALCWRRAMHDNQAGWFWAAEGPLQIGIAHDLELLELAGPKRITPTQAILFMRPPEAKPAAGATA
jgi:hypothetical protein